MSLLGAAPAALACTDDDAKAARAHNVSYVSSGMGGDAIPVVGRGDRYQVACDDISGANAQVRVVMALADDEDGDAGFAAVMATNTRVIGHGVKFVVPDLPDIANHTMNVKVYVTDGESTHACNAGRVKVV
ncbi:MAG: hypothetical protein JO348_09290 [Alphaproteobacteria bacterium]|nr:hypothetical protein [Alphaproteobacteria bacterium]